MSSKLKYLDPRSVYGVNSQTDSAENIRYHNHRSKDDNKQQALYSKRRRAAICVQRVKTIQLVNFRRIRTGRFCIVSFLTMAGPLHTILQKTLRRCP